jgi:hypothetical protein
MASNTDTLGQVFVFNSTATQLYMIVNNGPTRLMIFPASTNNGWQPAPARPPFSFGGVPLPDVFGIGDNRVSITPVSAGGTVDTVITLPPGLSRGDALQIYISMYSTQMNMWMLLRNGKPIGGDVVLKHPAH